MAYSEFREMLGEIWAIETKEKAKGGDGRRLEKIKQGNLQKRHLAKHQISHLVMLEKAALSGFWKENLRSKWVKTKW